MNRCLFFLCVLLFMIPKAQSADWNQWRGANRNGVDADSPDLITQLPVDGLEAAWLSETIPSAGKGGWSSPIVSKGRVYLFAHTKTKVADPSVSGTMYPYLAPEQRTGMSDEEYAKYEQNRRDEQEAKSKAFHFDELIYCLDATTGKTLWKDVRTSQYTRFPQSGSPVEHEGRLIVLGAGRLARCLDAETGRHRWETKLPGEFRDEYMQSSFVVAGDVAVVYLDALFGLNIDDGTLIWTQAEFGGSVLQTSPVVWDSEQGPVVICNTPKRTTIGVRPGDGKVVWTLDSEAGNSTPVVEGDLLLTYGGSRKGGLCAYRLNAGQPKELWRYQKLADPGSSPVVVDGNIYVQGERRLACVDLHQGVTQWTTTLDIGRPRYTSLIAAGKSVIYAFDGVLSFAADPNEYREHFNTKIDAGGRMASEETFQRLLDLDPLRLEPGGEKEAARLLREALKNAGPLPCSSPAISDGKMYIRLIDKLACYDLTQTK